MNEIGMFHMMLLRHAARRIVLPFAAATLTACGGGGGSGAGSPPPPVPTGWVQGQFAPESNFAAMCVTPRTGIDPGTQKPYPDVQGTLLDELNWLRSWNNDLYLWFDEVTDQNPANFTTDAAYFNVLMTTRDDRVRQTEGPIPFHLPTSIWEQLSQSGVQAGYGANFVIVAATPPRDVVVAYTEPGSPAATPPASFARGAQLLTIDGVDLVNATDQASVNILNAGLSPQTVGESHTFSVLDDGATAPRTITMVSANVTSTPVQNVHTITAPNGNLSRLHVVQRSCGDRRKRTGGGIFAVAKCRRARLGLGHPLQRRRVLGHRE